MFSLLILYEFTICSVMIMKINKRKFEVTNLIRNECE